MQTAFTDEVPEAEVRGGMVYITMANSDHATVVAPLHVVRRFCEVTIRKINAWDVAQAGRGTVVPMRRTGE